MWRGCWRRGAPTLWSFTLESVVGNDRKTTGAYYTPTSLIDCLLDSALDPLLDEADRAADPEEALLALTVCDPACGSGHFLVAAAKRIAARLATARARGNADVISEPTIIDEQRAMHDVVDRCIYGVDLNPMAAELARVSLWLESVQPGRALSFLNAHIKVGNALLGATPALLAPGLPDAAFTPLDGDDKKIVASLRKRNKLEREGQGNLFGQAGISVSNDKLGRTAQQMDALPNTTLADVHLAQQRFGEFDTSPELRQARAVADAWCAAFVAGKVPGRPELTHATIERLADGGILDPVTGAILGELSSQYRFFHWHLEFPQIFIVSEATATMAGPGWQGGFSCVLGNPPWERIKLQEQEFFAALDPDVAGAPNAAERKRMIAALVERNPALHDAYEAAKRRADGESQLIRLTGRFPLCGRGDINTYAVFAEHDRSILGHSGRLGVVLPTGIATDATTQHFFKDLVMRRSLASMYDFENRRPLFEGIDSRIKFCVLTVAGFERPVDRADFAFFLQHPDDLAREGARFELTPDELLLLNPNTGTCPVFRSRRDAEITLAIYRRHPVLIRTDDEDPSGNPWSVTMSSRLWHTTEDAQWFNTREQLEADGWALRGNVFERSEGRMVPLFEGKMVHQFDHRWATYDGLQTRELSSAERADPGIVALPRYWVSESEVLARLEGRWSRPWLMGFRDITNPTNERTMIAAALPMAAVANSLPLIFVAAAHPAVLCAVFSSLVFDFVTRLKMGGSHINFFIAEQLPVPTPWSFDDPCQWDSDVTYSDWIMSRMLELVYTAADMRLFAVDYGDGRPPFVWDEARRTQLRSELDACFLLVYGLDRLDAEYVVNSFPIANRKDPQLLSRVLGAYDELVLSASSGVSYVSPMTPPPGHGSRHG